MRNFALGFLIAVAVCVLVVYGFFRWGGMPVATHAAPLPLEKTLARLSIRAATHDSRSLQSPLAANDENLTRGADVYVKHCAGCHGLPHETPGAFVKAMFPNPPQLFQPDDEVTDDPIGVIQWKVKNGIRLSGMPGFDHLISEDQIWQVSLLLKHADHLPSSAQELLKPRAH